MPEWRSARLGDVAAAVTVGFVGSMAAEYRDSGIPFLRSLNVRPHRIEMTAVKYIDPAFHCRLKKSALRPGDVVTVRTGKPGQTAVVPDWLTDANCSDLVITRPGPELNGKWLSYYLNWITDSQVAERLVGAVQQHFNARAAASLVLALPPATEQAAIAEILGALDDKIAVNDRIRTLTDALCSARFQRVSTNHDVGRLSSIAIVNAATTKPRADGRLRYVDISAVGVGDYDLPKESKWSEAPGRARRVLRTGDTIWSTVRPNRRSHALVLDEDFALVASTGLAVLTPLAGKIAGLYESCRTDQFVGYLESVAEGSAYPAVRADRFNNAPVPALRAKDWAEFERFALPLRQRAHAASVESRNLEAARDELLPLLMSGKLRVRDAERQAEDVL